MKKATLLETKVTGIRYMARNIKELKQKYKKKITQIEVQELYTLDDYYVISIYEVKYA